MCISIFDFSVLQMSFHFLLTDLRPLLMGHDAYLKCLCFVLITLLVKRPVLRTSGDESRASYFKAISASSGYYNPK